MTDIPLSVILVVEDDLNGGREMVQCSNDNRESHYFAGRQDGLVAKMAGVLCDFVTFYGQIVSADLTFCRCFCTIPSHEYCKRKSHRDYP